MDDGDGRQDPVPPALPPEAPTQGLPLVPSSRAITAPIPREPASTPSVYVPRFGSLNTYFSARLVAFVIDVFGIAFVIATFLFNLVFSQVTSANAAPLFALGISLAALKNAFQGSFLVLAAAAFIGAFVFIWICETILGSTLGKLLFGLAIRRAAGGRAGPLRIILRNLIRPIDALIVGGLLALVTPKHQRIGDLVGGTIVVRSPLGPVATIIAACGFIALGYAQFMYGGGIGSAAGVVAQSAIALPGLVARFGGRPQPEALPSPSAAPTASAAPTPTEPPAATSAPAPADSP
jgi:uncharacterized RDD family membrane protein YckC